MLNYTDDESDQSNARKEEVKGKKKKGNGAKKARKEDAIDRIMKNEYIRKNSKIDYEKDPLEDIIGSQKIEKNIKGSVIKKSQPKTKFKGRKKHKGETKKQKIHKEEIKTPIITNLNSKKEITPEKTRDLDFKEMEKNAESIVDLLEEQTHNPEEEIHSKIEKVTQKEIVELPVEISLQQFEIFISPIESKLINPQKIQRDVLLPTKIKISTKDDFKLKIKDIPYQKGTINHYSAVKVTRNKTDQVHVYPEFIKLGQNTQRVYSRLS